MFLCFSVREVSLLSEAEHDNRLQIVCYTFSGSLKRAGWQSEGDAIAGYGRLQHLEDFSNNLVMIIVSPAKKFTILIENKAQEISKAIEQSNDYKTFNIEL